MSFWRDRRVLVTGHTGFKGAWLCLWLEKLGAKVTGIAQPPHTDPSLFTLLSPWPSLDHRIADVTQAEPIGRAIAASNAEIVIHMAAQALVPAGQSDPVGTFATNLMGTVHVLQAALALPALRAALIVTTDKVYADPDSGRAFAEGDPLGGNEPYGSSKAAAELAVDAYRPLYAAKRIGLGSARAGNVIGGGDWSADRLVPDLVRALWSGEPALLRNPAAIRPWQHVFDPLVGYLRYAEGLAEDPSHVPPALNFAPPEASARPVIDVADRFAARFNDHPRWQSAGAPKFHEAAILRLSAAKAAATLAWRPRLDFESAVAWTTDWYAAHRHGDDMRKLSLAQIAHYEALG